MTLTLKLNNFGPFREACWAIPQGVSTLVGPNGAGKTSLLKALEFWRDCYLRTVPGAIQALGGVARLRHWDALPSELVTLQLEDSGSSATARMEVGSAGGGIDMRIGEELRLADEVLFQRDVFSDRAQLGTQKWMVSGGKTWVDPARIEETRALIDRRAWTPLTSLWSLRVYPSARNTRAIESLRQSGSSFTADVVLDDWGGQNVFTVLRNWRDKRATRSRWQFVHESMRAAFPGMFEDLEFDTAGQIIAARVVVPGRQEAVPHAFMSDGWFHGLLSLTAIAAAEDHSLIAFDEIENALHPHAIHEILRSFRQRAHEHDLSIVIATHSPVVLNQFHEERGSVFVLEADLPSQPVSLADHPDAEWLQHFSVGDSYAQERVGAPKISHAAE